MSTSLSLVSKLSKPYHCFTMTSSDGVSVTTTEKGILMKYDLTFNDNNIYLKRKVDLQPFNRSTVICIGRKNLTSIRLDEGPDLRTATLIAVGSGLGIGVSGLFILHHS